jgi:dTDP-glucose pyrophosphorylase
MDSTPTVMTRAPRRLNVLMPMGGLGSRFAHSGWRLPKPLIRVGTLPMFRQALRSLDAYRGAWTLTAVIRRELERDFPLGEEIRGAVSDATVVVIEALTRGSVETALAASPFIRDDDGVLVLDCDLWFVSPAYFEAVADVLAGRTAHGGVLLSFAARDPRYSYALLEGERVRRTAEKQVISSDALAGAYFFASGAQFKAAAAELLTRPTGGEFYTSLLFNLLIERGESVVARRAERYLSFGTPEELRHASAVLAH